MSTAARRSHRGDEYQAAVATYIGSRDCFGMTKGSEAEDAAAFAEASRIGRQRRRTIGGEPFPRPELQQLIDLADSKEPELGWDLLDRCVTTPHPALLELAGEALYYQLRDQFGRVAPYLNRMLAEAPGQAGETWSRLSTLAVLEGHITEDELFHSLATLDQPALWKGAVSVFAANIGQPELALTCRSGLSRILDFCQTGEIVFALDQRQINHIGFHAADLRLVDKFIDCIGPSLKLKSQEPSRQDRGAKSTR